MSITPEDLRDLRAMEFTAKGGREWRYKHTPDCQVEHIVIEVDSEGTLTIASSLWTNEQTAKRMQFIAAAANLVLPLLDEVERLRVEVERLKNKWWTET